MAFFTHRRWAGRCSRPGLPHTLGWVIQLLAVLVLGVASPGCKSGETPRSGAADAREETAPAGVPGDFRMVFGQGGGFTGRWDGYTIEPDGTVLSWTGRMAGEGSAPAGRLPDAELEALWEQINEARFFEAREHETSNMTAFIELTAGGRTHRRTWAPSADGFEPPHSAVDSLYRYSLRLARQADTNQ